MRDDGTEFEHVRLHSRHVTAGRNGRRVASIVVASAALVASSLVVSGASAAPRPTLEQVQRNVEQMQEQAEQSAEDFNETKERLASINVRLRAAKEKLTRQRGEVAKARTEVGRLAAETYRRGQMTTLDVLLGDDPDAVLAQAGYLPSLGERQNGATNRLKAGEEELAATQKDIQVQQKKAEAANDRMKTMKKSVEAKLAAAQAQLNTLEASQRAAVRRSMTSVQSAGVPSGANAAYCRGMAAKATNSGARAALTFACNQLGDPYVWAADGPDSYDCSGLTMKAWQAGGRSLPHSSKLQATYGTPVSAASMEPGDLIFFYSPISHVSLYLGDGLMVTAPSTGDVVKISSIYRTPSAVVRL